MSDLFNIFHRHETFYLTVPKDDNRSFLSARFWLSERFGNDVELSGPVWLDTLNGAKVFTYKLLCKTDKTLLILKMMAE